jgi:hypothetical protein
MVTLFHTPTSPTDNDAAMCKISDAQHPDKKGKAGIGKACYAESPFFMERELATAREWNPNAVIKRRKRLVKWAKERWAVPDDVSFDVQPVSADQEGYTESDLEPEE